MLFVYFINEYLYMSLTFCTRHRMSYRIKLSIKVIKKNSSVN